MLTRVFLTWVCSNPVTLMISCLRVYLRHELMRILRFFMLTRVFLTCTFMLPRMFLTVFNGDGSISGIWTIYAYACVFDIESCA
jgi:hypothetical protein